MCITMKNRKKSIKESFAIIASYREFVVQKIQIANKVEVYFKLLHKQLSYVSSALIKQSISKSLKRPVKSIMR